MVIYLRNIKFPVYPLSKKSVITVEGPVVKISSNLTERILDDRSVSGDTLGQRRLHIDKKLLHPLKRSISGIGNFLLYTKVYGRFIDSDGTIFKYKPTTFVPLIYRSILRAVPYKNGTMLKLDSIHCPIWFYRPLNEGEDYAVLLYIEKGYVLLGVTNQPSKRNKFKV